MSTIIHLPVREAHPDRDTEARKRADRLNRAITEEMQAALAFLSMIDPDAFDVAFQAVPPNLDDLPDVDGPEPFCGRCGVAIFPGQGETWQHYRGMAVISSKPKIAGTAHEPEVEWYLPDEAPDDC
jgi:hypothetical protein